MKNIYVQQNLQSITSNLDDTINENDLNEVISFFQNDNSGVCSIEGVAGTFKTALFNKVCECFNSDVLVFRFKCFKGTTLEDIFLRFLEDLKKYAQERKIGFMKIETNSLSARINAYMSHLNYPAVILIDSLENVFERENETEKEEILNFLNHLVSMQKFKIVLISEPFDSALLGSEIAKKIVIKPYDKELTKRYFEKMGSPLTVEELNALYLLTKGSPKAIYITANLITMLNTTATAIITEYSKKNHSYIDFLINKLLTFITEKVMNSLKTLSFVNIGVSVAFLEENKFFTSEQINYLSEKNLISNEYGYVYIKDQTKAFIQTLVSAIEKPKIHKFWRDFYEAQLPLKPNARTILISRNTMRNQIEYHSAFVLTEEKTANSTNISLMRYLKSDISAWNNIKMNVSTEIREGTNRPEMPESLKNRQGQLDKYTLTRDELALMNVPVDILEQKEKTAQRKVNEAIKEYEENTKVPKLSEVISLADSFDKAHSFDDAYKLYQNAYSLTSDAQYSSLYSKLLLKLALAAKKVNKTVDAVDWYNKLVEYYLKNNEKEKSNLTKLEIAKIYKETYKIGHSRVIYETFVSDSENTETSVLARSYVALAEIEEEQSNIQKAVEYYKKAFELASQLEDESIFADAYFKYALILDDFNNTSEAFKYYKKCIEVSTLQNVYISSAYTNIAEILTEKGNLKEAEDNYKQGLKIDIELSNHEGIYYITKKLAELHEKINPDKIHGWLLKSLTAAKNTNESLYIANAYIGLGKFYENANLKEKALKAYLFARKNAEQLERNSREMLESNSKVNALLLKLPKQVGDRIEKEVKKHE